MIKQVQKETEPLLLLKYFNIFRHPLRLDEILKFSGKTETVIELEAYLDELIAAGTISKMGNYYLYEGDQQYIDKREKGEAYAARLIPKAKRSARFIALFPFVKFVGISGSLSKGYADEKTDFDFFIVTAANTLWICRTLLHLVKKMSYLIGKQHSMCMNYFIDEQKLELEEKNIFTQIELSTLIPVYNQDMYRLILLSNKNNLPNLQHLGLDIDEDEYNTASLLIKEKNTWWRPLNILLMKLTDAKWRKKWKKNGYPMSDYALALKTTPYISKNHPKNYQKIILNHLQTH
ncbi:MAG: hypothetical protein WC756_11325 [Taibaiella sp.]|jgi:hypothetical protein